MKTTKLKTISKKAKKSIRFDKEAVEHILKFLNSRYLEYTVEVELISNDNQRFDDLNTAIKLADENEDYLSSITITAQKDTENFNLKFVKPEKKSEETVLLECSSEGKGLYKAEYFFDDLIKLMRRYKSAMSSKAFRVSVYCALIVNIYMSLNNYLNNTFSLLSYIVPFGILAVGYLTGIILLNVKAEVPQIEIYIDDEKIRKKYQGQEWKIQARTILYFVLLVAAGIIQLLIR